MENQECSRLTVAVMKLITEVSEIYMSLDIRTSTHLSPIGGMQFDTIKTSFQSVLRTEYKVMLGYLNVLLTHSQWYLKRSRFIARPREPLTSFRRIKAK